jgi:nucleotide sugar dehydrogenase
MKDVVSVIGLGKIGLPLAIQCALSGFLVWGCDTNLAVVEGVNNKVEPFPGEPDLAEKLSAVIRESRLEATPDTSSAVEKSSTIVVVVPVLVDYMGKSDFRFIDSATRDIARGLQSGTLVIYETTLPIGTTSGRLRKILEKESGLLAGQDFHLAFSPERVASGQVFANFKRYPKLVGGFTVECSKRAREFYEKAIDFETRPDLVRPNGVWELGSCEAAEFAKLAETTYRDVNIGLANQFAQHADELGLNIYQIIEGCNSQHYSHIHSPGIAVGGHCIPVYPQMYLESSPSASIVRAARLANQGMPDYAVNLLAREFGDLNGSKVGILGLAYRGGVKESAFSGSFALRAALQDRGAEVYLDDPLYSPEEITLAGFSPFTDSLELDSIILQTDHRQYRELTSSDIRGAKVLVDGRNIVPKELSSTLKVVTLGSLQSPIV